jgi:hypothetical protein
MARIVTVRLTEAEARALSHVAGNSTSAPDAMGALFRSGAQRAAAYRGHEKLDAALRGEPEPAK